MFPRKQVLALAVSAALLGGPPAAIADSPDTRNWAAVPDETLAALRGGLSLGALTGYFAIERIVRVDGVDVARTVLTIDDVGKLARGSLPNVQILGNLANLIQIGPINGTAAGTSAAQQAVAVAEAATAAALQRSNAVTQNAQDIAAAAAATAQRAGQVAIPAGTASAPVSSAAIGNSAVSSSANFGSSSMAQLGSGLEQAVGVATGEIAAAPPAPAPVATRAPAPVATPAPAPVVTPPAAVAPAPVGQPAPTPAAAAPAIATAPVSTTVPAPATATMVIPIGNTGQFVVVSNIPNAAPLATAIQNSVAATQIQAQTRISANLDNSLSSLRAGALAAAIRDQAIQSVR
jgi:hypothetical protein